jgi:acetyl-CoA/propionyl-CoA carboxylase biotin carboxyl carrier protein
MSLPRPFARVLIANRGEIAVRIARTCRVLGIHSIAVYHPADADALHVKVADEAVALIIDDPRGAYLDIPGLVDIARETRADAVHPGYGFLSENAAFARALEDAGIVFVGPSAEVLEGSADKLIVKQRVAAGGVPVIPGPLEAVADTRDALLAGAAETGYPLLLKAVAGGGGKGMRRVDAESELLEASAAARREAGGSFGNTALYLERVIAPARHVEVQILCDNHGGVLVIGERDCSMQRRHQKVLEECPAPGLSDEVRTALHQAGADAARALDYRGAGTVECLLGADGQFHFLELNRRLQVEHPVTECCFGLDLVAWQLHVAAGAKVPDSLPAPLGHAIEARVYAEDPATGFLPSAGPVHYARPPEGPGIRVDSCLQPSFEVSPHYDPLLAKVVAHGATREEALARLDQALEDTVVLGVSTNIAFLRALLAEDDFAHARLRIDALDEKAEALATLGEPRDDVFLAAALAFLSQGAQRRRAASGAASMPSPWERLPGFRLSEGAGS